MNTYINITHERKNPNFKNFKKMKKKKKINKDRLILEFRMNLI